MSPPRSLRPLLPPALLGVAAVALGGIGGVILGFVAVLLLIDRWLDRLAGITGWGIDGAERAFRRLDRKRRRDELERRFRRLAPDGDRLRYLADDAGWVAVAQRRRLGVQTIAIASIVGTDDAQKAVAFDRAFRPPRWSRVRWTLMCRAAQAGATLPPISVYRVGAEHYVRDGHHRVSVARALGADGIDAEVVELVRASRR